ncbi:cupin domain-containing protein [Paenibacillus peoriae]|uniref:cupin domain-containing protein n=1 Tax=Paenibacillus peoriae TaxID=59893 RepID=UPI003F9C2366
MYHKSCHHYPWHNPILNSWNNNYRGDNSQYYNWYNNDGNPYGKIMLRDYGQNPLVVNIDQATKQNKTYRTALWTGKYFQVTLMSINVSDDIGLEVHPTTDQFIRIEEGQGLVQMGDRKDNLDFQVMAYDDYAIMIPAGKWHNITNTGNIPLKVYVIYAPPEHPYGTVHETKEIAMHAER